MMSDKEKQWDGLGKLLNDMGSNYGNAVRDGVNQSVADDAAFAKKYSGAVRGGTGMVDFNAIITPSDVGHLTVSAPAIEVGGNPKNALLRTILKDHGAEIAGDVGNAVLRDRPGFVNSISSEGSVLFLNTGATITPRANTDLMDNIQLNFDIKFAAKVVQWCNDNPNGAAIKVGDTTIAYDKKMVDQLRENAQQVENRLLFPDRRSSNDGELPGKTPALTPDSNANVVASAQINGAQSPEFKNNPTVQQVSAALERNGIALDNQNPSLVAGLAGAAANLSKVQDVALTPQTAFALDRDKFDPAANRASVSMDVANKPFDEVWRTASVALQQTQAPAVVAQAQGQDMEQKQSARTM